MKLVAWTVLRSSKYFIYLMHGVFQGSSLQTKDGSSRILSTVSEFGHQISQGLKDRGNKTFKENNYRESYPNNRTTLQLRI